MNDNEYKELSATISLWLQTEITATMTNSTLGRQTRELKRVLKTASAMEWLLCDNIERDFRDVEFTLGLVITGYHATFKK